MISTPKNHYSTTNLALATTLSLWLPLEGIDKSSGSQRANFLFAKSNQLEKLITSFWKGDLRVEPQSFFNKLKAVKTRLYE